MCRPCPRGCPRARREEALATREIDCGSTRWPGGRAPTLVPSPVRRRSPGHTVVLDAGLAGLLERAAGGAAQLDRGVGRLGGDVLPAALAGAVGDLVE